MSIGFRIVLPYDKNNTKGGEVYGVTVQTFKLLLAWLFSLFCFATFIVYGLFSVTGFLGLWLGILALPLRPVHHLWQKMLPPESPRFARVAILAAAFCVMVAAAPNNAAIPASDIGSVSSASALQKNLVPVPTRVPAESCAAIVAEPTEAPTPAADKDDFDSPQQESTSAAQSNTVYVASSGKGSRYHSTPDCSGMKAPIALSVEEAEAQGYTPCKRCCG